VPEGDDLVKEAYQLREFEATLTGLGVRTDFKSWHKPRKQYIRLQQWCKEVEKLIGKLGLKEGRSLRYLGLPGEDLLDIRVLEGVCLKHDVRLRYLGFDASLTGVATNLASHEVNGKSFIDPGSIVIGDKFEKLVEAGSVANRRVQDHGTFDVINIDLCGSVTKSDASGQFPSLEAIARLCESQIRSPGHPWLLFLTTRALQDEMTPDLGSKLFSAVLQNVSRHAAFRADLANRLSLDSALVEQMAACETRLEGQHWLYAYVLALSKWLLGLMLSSDYKVAVRLLTSYSYAVSDTGSDMASLAFFFEPGPVQFTDESGLTGVRPDTAVLSAEPELALELIEAVAAIQDLDAMMELDPDLHERYIQKTITLLAPLRYGAEAYRNFALGPG